MRFLALILGATLLLGTVAEASPTHVPAPRHNWIEQQPRNVQETWACVMWHESRSTMSSLNLMDNNPYGSSGIFQIEQGTWAAHQLAAKVPLRIHVWQANVYQQFAVARTIYLANGFQPWYSDGCF